MSALRFSIDAIPLYLGTRVPQIAVDKVIWDTLKPEYHLASITMPVRLYPKELIKQDYMQVVSGTLTQELPEDTGPSDGTPTSWHVVAKIAFGPRRIEPLREEASVYNTKLSKLQGKYVPMVYGFYVGESCDGPVAILLMQDCGRRMVTALKGQPLDIRRVLSLADTS